MSRVVKRCVQNLGCLVGGLLLLTLPAAAQLAVGDNLKVSLSGDLSTGYAATFGSGGSSHGMDLGGGGSLHGYYYAPQFISFDVLPYLNRSQANSAYQSITDSSGLSGTVSLFSGSHFPGSISLGKSYNTSGQFGLPGVTGLASKASGDTLGINWAASVPKFPSLSVSYLQSSDAGSVYGTSRNTEYKSRAFYLQSNYSLAGFLFNGSFNHQSLGSNFPDFLNSAGTLGGGGTTQGSNTSYQFMASHKIPLRGYWSASAGRTNYSSETASKGLSGAGNGTSDSAATTASVQLAHNLGASVGVSYQTNVLGAIQEQLLQAGEISPLRSTDSSSQSMIVRSDTFYQLSRHITIYGQWNHQQQYIGGKTIALTQYGGGVSSSYSHHLLGSLTYSIGAIDTASQQGNSGAGMYGSLGYSRRLFRRWETGADFNYSQQVQTLGSIYTTSVYGYGGNVRRKFGDRTYWSNSARETHSGLSQQVGSSSHSESLVTSLLYRKYSGSVSYSQSGGTAILTSQGLVAVPTGIPTPLVTMPVLYNARSYGGGGTASIMRFALSGSYSKALSSTTARSLASNGTTMLNFLVRCRMRKMYLNAGYTRFEQSVGAVGATPSVVNSYYFGISRWFNVF